MYLYSIYNFTLNDLMYLISPFFLGKKTGSLNGKKFQQALNMSLATFKVKNSRATSMRYSRKESMRQEFICSSPVL